MEVTVGMTGAESWADMEKTPLGLSLHFYNGHIRLTEVKKRSPAFFAGLKKGDSILAYQGCDQPTNAQDFRDFLKACWKDLKPAVLRVQKKTDGVQGGRPKKSSSRPFGQDSDQKRRGFWKDSKATQAAIQERLKLFRQQQDAMKEKHRGAYTEWAKRHEQGERTVKWWVLEQDSLMEEAQRDVVALASRLPDYGASLFSSLSPPNAAEDCLLSVKVRACHELTMSALREAYTKRGQMSAEDRSKVEAEMAELGRREGLAAELSRRVRAIRDGTEQDAVALTAAEDGPFREALTKLIGYDIAGSLFSFQAIPTIVKNISAFYNKNSVSYFRMELEGLTGAMMEATLVRVPLGEGGKVGAVGLGLGGSCEELFHSAMDHRRKLSSWASGVGDAGTPYPFTFPNPKPSSSQ